MSKGPGEGISWFKIIMFGMVALMLAGIASVILDRGYGAVDEARRIRHPAGFSIVQPQGWGSTLFYARGGAGQNTINMAPERVAGRQTVVAALRPGRAPKLAPTATKTTFQNKEAWATFTQRKREADYRLDFQRDGVWFAIVVTSPIALEWDRDPLMKFVASFRTEAIIGDLKVADDIVDEATSQPATVPAATP